MFRSKICVRRKLVCVKCDSPWRNPGMNTKVQGQESSPWEEKIKTNYLKKNNNENC